MPAASPIARRPGPDACPGVRSVWSAADGGLARVRIPGGRLTVEQLRVLADAAQELGSGVLELTARANVQVRGLRPGVEQELAARLRPVGLLPSDTHDRVRNILASPLTGLLGRADVTDVVVASDEQLCARPQLADLPGRFLFAVDDGSRDVGLLGPDAGLIATGDFFALVLGGVELPLLVAWPDAAAALLATADGFLAERARQHSAAWRVTELTDGPSRIAARVAAVVDTIEATVAPGTSCTTASPPAGVVAQVDGRFAATVEVPEGRLAAPTVRALAAAAAADCGLRVTPWRSVVLPGLTQPAALDCVSLASEEVSAIATGSSDATRVAVARGSSGADERIWR